MKEVIDVLKGLVEDPDNIDKLPQAIAQLEEHQQTVGKQEEDYQDRIMKLQQSNRSLLSQVPIPGNEPEPEPEKEATLEDAQAYLISTLGGDE